MSSALTQLQDQIETIRREAYQTGYDAAMQAVLAFATQQPGSTRAKPPAKARSAKVTAKKTIPGAPVRRRQSRGNNAALVSEALKSLPNHSGRGADIRKAVKGKNLAFTSIRHALVQLQARGEASLADDGKTWSYIPAHAG
jgi:hypothetical protein